MYLLGEGALILKLEKWPNKFFPMRLHLFYGSSETSFITISDEFTPVGSVGKAFPNVKIKVEESGPQ